jgi:hypothetical protein
MFYFRELASSKSWGPSLRILSPEFLTLMILYLSFCLLHPAYRQVGKKNKMTEEDRITWITIPELPPGQSPLDRY